MKYRITNAARKYRWQDPLSGLTIGPLQTVENVDEKIVNGYYIQMEIKKRREGKRSNILVEEMPDKTPQKSPKKSDK